MKHVISAQKRAGMKPAKIQCRNNPRFTHDLRPEFRIVWNKDDSKRSWKIEARSNDYIPIARKREGWTLRSGESYTLKKSGKYFGCWIFYR